MKKVKTMKWKLSKKKWSDIYPYIFVDCVPDSNQVFIGVRCHDDWLCSSISDIKPIMDIGIHRYKKLKHFPLWDHIISFYPDYSFDENVKTALIFSDQ